MNFIVLICDTLRYDHLACNGARPITTPNFDAFARIATRFSRCYAGSYPSQPHRCDCVSGRHVFPFYGWQEMPEDERELVSLLGESGYQTHFVSDGGLTLTLGSGRGYQSHEVIPNEISDELVEQTPWPCDPKKSRMPDSMRRHWALRTHAWNVEEDWPQPRVMNAASRWLKKDRGDPFFLWIESWRIHEPWIDPQEFVELYDPGYSGEIVALPSYSPDVDYLTPAELNHVRAMYAASVTFTDKWLGALLRTVEEAGLLDDTCIVLSSDHGFSLGDHGRTGKHGVPSPRQEPWPLYEECTHVPLLVHLPGQAHAAASGRLVQHVDLLPTVFDLAGLDLPETCRGVSWRPLLEGGDRPLRTLAVTAPGIQKFPDSGNCRITLTTEQWALILPTDRREPELYNLAVDPGQTINVFSRHRDVAAGIHADFLDLLKGLDADPAKIRSWTDIL